VIALGEGIAVDVIPDWDTRIGRTSPATFPTTTSQALLHGANFALPERRGEFGDGVVETMGPAHVFTALIEYGPESVGKGLFASQGLPRQLHPDWFDPNLLERPLPGHAGLQRFFTDHDRTFCLYVVLGGYAQRAGLVDAANLFLAGITVLPRPTLRLA